MFVCKRAFVLVSVVCMRAYICGSEPVYSCVCWRVNLCRYV